MDNLSKFEINLIKDVYKEMVEAKIKYFYNPSYMNYKNLQDILISYNLCMIKYGFDLIEDLEYIKDSKVIYNMFYESSFFNK